MLTNLGIIIFLVIKIPVLCDNFQREQRLIQIHGPQTTAALHVDMYSMKLFSKDKRQVREWTCDVVQVRHTCVICSFQFRDFVVVYEYQMENISGNGEGRLATEAMAR